MKILKIKWQRLLHGGQTCPRCKSTGDEVEKAVIILKESLKPMNIEVVLEKEALTETQFKKDTLESNRIWINDIPMEEYIGGKVGQSTCCDVCGPHECRTVNIEKEVLETIPCDTIVKAGLLAASSMI
ncbi:DUF2703 domain-containing protein [Flavobacterium maritimum]|uniref:DUF2703 domain-containing protein n=1 Tax=Flavobacterium maritimum TaxID=3149042 RepID=UPI0032B5465F